MNYSEALDVALQIVEEALGITADASTDLIEYLSNNVALEALIRAIKLRTELTLSPREVRNCRTVGDLAQLIAARKQPERVQLSPSDHDDAGEASTYSVWFGTNRRLITAPNGQITFSSLRGGALHVGTCEVLVPKSHKIGSLGSPWWKRLVTGDDRLQLLRIEKIAYDAYWRSMGQALEVVDSDDRDAIVFVHGYNVSFSDAALRTAQIGFDLSFKGAMTFFSWPSRDFAPSYMADEATIDASEPVITQFLTDVATRVGARAVHIIAHSMGNRGVIRAINRIASEAERRSTVRFGQIILAAPDIDVDVFRDLCKAYSAVARRTTLYVCAKDRAIEASGWLHEYARVGLTPPICVVPGIDTINVTNVDLTILGHGYVAEARDVLRDIHDLITHGTIPDRRFGLRQSSTASGQRFWVIGP